MDNRGKDATVYIEVEGGHEVYEIYIGGAAETWHDAAHNKNKAHIRRAQSRGKIKDTDIYELSERYLRRQFISKYGYEPPKIT